MKRCPTCNQTFEEEWLSFCTADGTTLLDEPASGSYPPPTVMSPNVSEPPPAEEPFRSASPSASPFEDPFREAKPPQPAWQQQTPSQWQPPPPPPFAAPPNKSLATASLVIGIISLAVGWMCFGPLPAILSIVLGGVALSQMKKNPERFGGSQMAWTGIVTGSISLVIWVIVMIIYLIATIASSSSGKF